MGHFLSCFSAQQSTSNFNSEKNSRLEAYISPPKIGLGRTNDGYPFMCIVGSGPAPKGRPNVALEREVQATGQAQTAALYEY